MPFNVFVREPGEGGVFDWEVAGDWPAENEYDGFRNGNMALDVVPDIAP